MEPEGSLPYSQVPATCPYPEEKVTTEVNNMNTVGMPKLNRAKSPISK
jgi:hypothetical protein